VLRYLFGYAVIPVRVCGLLGGCSGLSHGSSLERAVYGCAESVVCLMTRTQILKRWLHG